jgi:CheY-like chemotaxis protein
MVYGFVRQSGGHLDLHSALGEGTRVEIYLPCSKSPVGSHERPELAGVPRGKGETILLCEDDVDVRTFSAESLDELGYNVLSAHDGPTALELLREANPVDLLFTDVVLPGGMTGADLARKAREIQPGLKVLFATGYARDALDDATIDGGVEVLPKPFSVGELAQRLRRILR